LNYFILLDVTITMNMRKITFLSILLLSTAFISCKSKKLALENYQNLNLDLPEDYSSYLTVNYKLDKKGIQDTFNMIIDQYLAGDMEFGDYGLDITIKKEDEATFEFEGRNVLINLPIFVAFSKKTIFADIQAEGALSLTFKSDVEIDSSWNLFTNSRLENYEWTKKPKLNLGGLSLNVENIANNIIEKSKEEFARNIDLSIQEQFALRARMLEVLQTVEQPYLFRNQNPRLQMGK